MVYFFNGYEGFNAEKLAEALPADRFEKFKRLRMSRDRENCVYSYLILKSALKNDFGIDDFQLSYNENGKPYIKNSEAYFNISHCKSGIAVAVDSSPVGADIQEITDCREKIMRRVFSEAETNSVLKSSDPDAEFTRLWTLKECAVKYFGTGIAQMGEFEFADTANTFTKYGKIFQIFELKGIMLSVCSDCGGHTIKTINKPEV